MTLVDLRKLDRVISALERLERATDDSVLADALGEARSSLIRSRRQNLPLELQQQQ